MDGKVFWEDWEGVGWLFELWGDGEFTVGGAERGVGCASAGCGIVGTCGEGASV